MEKTHYKFRKFLKKRCADNDVLEKFMEEFIDAHEDRVDEINENSFEDVLPGIELIASYFDPNICYHGRECSAFGRNIYKWENYYIVYEYDTEGDDLEVLSININYEDINLFFDSCFYVYHEEKLDLLSLLDKINDIDFIMQFFHNIFGKKKGRMHLLTYIENMFQIKYA